MNKKMIKLNQLCHLHTRFLIGSYLAVFASAMQILASFEANLVPNVTAYSERSMTLEHEIQTMDESKFCKYSVSILVLDNNRSEAIPDALVEFETPLFGTISNRTDLKGNTDILLTLEKGPQQETCTEKLLSQGYSIEAFKEGYVGYGFGSVS
jgi:hypothetical protein